MSPSGFTNDQQTSEQAQPSQLVVALDVATKISGVAIFYQKILVATWSVSLNPELNYGSQKLAADLLIIESLFVNKIKAVCNYISNHFNQNHQIKQVSIVIEQSLHDHHQINQKLHFYCGLYLAYLEQSLKAVFNDIVIKIKLLPPQEWMMRVFNQQLERDAAKAFSKQQGLVLIKQQVPYLKQYLALEQPMFYDFYHYDDNQADAINIGFNEQDLRDVSVIKAEVKQRQNQVQKLQKQIKKLENNLLKFAQVEHSLLTNQLQKQHLKWTSELAQAKTDYQLLTNEKVLLKPKDVANRALNISTDVSTPALTYDWKERLILRIKALKLDHLIRDGQLDSWDENVVKQALVHLFKRRYYANQDYQIVNFDNGVAITIINEQIQCKKITGSKIAISADVGQFETLFSVWTKYWGLDLPVFNQKYVDAGNVVETKLVDYLKSAPGQALLKSGLNVSQAQSVVIKHLVAKDYQYDYFKDLNLDLGGVPDALCILENGQEVILEFKSANQKNQSKWLKFGVPDHYVKQAMVYTMLNKSTRFAIINFWLKDEDYQQIEQVNISAERLYSNFYELDLTKSEKLIKQAINNYQSVYQKRTSPIVTNLSIDQNLLKYLKLENQDQYGQYLWDYFWNLVNHQSHPFDEINLLTKLLS